MKSQENLFKGKIYSIGSEIGQGTIRHRAEVLESYNFLCLVRVQKAYTTGPFFEFGIYKIGYVGEHEEMLMSTVVDFETREGAPARRAGTEAETRGMFTRMVDKMKLQDSENELSKDRKIKETEAKEKADQLKAENFQFVKDSQDKIVTELRELVSTNKIEKLINENKVKDLVNNYNAMELLKKSIR